jgi:chemotaxis protein methyltransferase CheR
VSINRQEFEYVRDLVRANSGIVLETGKEYLVEARLRPLAERDHSMSVAPFIQRLKSGSSSVVHRHVVEAMTTNETSFFRDLSPFETLRKVVLPELIEKRRDERALTIWSAACSTGQEPYTVAITIREYFPLLAQWRCRIMASDLSTEVLNRARAGSYTQLEINRGMPAVMMVKYFARNRMYWDLRDEIRKMVDFFEVNLTRDLPPLPDMDIVMLRNVLIYFDVETKRRILEAVRRKLKPDGYLLLGNSETAFGVHDGFERFAQDRSGWHRKKK